MEAPAAGPAWKRVGKAPLALCVVLVSLVVSLGSLARTRPLSDLGGMADEWMYLGANLAIHGTLGVEREPILFRPPGYPAFVAAVLTVAVPLPARHDFSLELSFARALYSAQALTLAAAAGLLFLWIARRASVGVAILGGLLFGCNPYSVMLVGMRHYESLHWLLLVAGCLALEAALASRPSALRMLAVGALWGVATLTRPVTLLMPPFVGAAALWHRRALRPALQDTALFTLGLVLTVSPWTVRNYRLSGRIIPVNAQTWTVTWATTVEKTPAEADRYKWYKVATAHYRELYTPVTGRSEYDYLTFVRFVLPLEDAFKRAALDNLHRQPGVYLHNVAVSFLSLQTDVNAGMLTAFRRIQDGTRFDPGWLWLGSRRNLARGPEATAFAVLHGLLSLLALAGAAFGLRTRDPFVAVPVLVHLALCSAHSLTYLDTLYYYFKLPFLVVLAFYALGRAPRRVALPAAALLTAAALALTGWIHFA
jgi:hypothetical protein